jgi:hypothetical protein
MAPRQQSADNWLDESFEQNLSNLALISADVMIVGANPTRLRKEMSLAEIPPLIRRYDI